MAAAPPPTSPRYGNTQINKGRPQVSPVPETPIIIQDEENPIPDKYEGDINFNKIVYSLKEFRDKIDLGFNELLSTTPTVNIQQFFDLYNEVFFDIPKEGENSHTTIVQTSLDYLDNYENPLQSIIDARDLEIQSLNEQLLAIQTELTDLQLNIEQEEIAEQSQEANWLATYGSIEDPIIKLSWLKTNIETYRPQLNSDRDSYFENVKDDLNKAGSAGGNAARPASQWKTDINNVGGSTNNKKADLRALVDATVLKISSNAYEVITNAWKL
jgi:hypothetical protein